MEPGASEQLSNYYCHGEVHKRQSCRDQVYASTRYSLLLELKPHQMNVHSIIIAAVYATQTQILSMAITL